MFRWLDPGSGVAIVLALAALAASAVAHLL